jgi:parvulin-like peptidyl-prolyl isomerase
MTFRAKPVATRQSRPSRDGQSRRNFYLNIGFGLAVAIAVTILVGVAVVRFYSDHLAAAATVNGQAISKDDFKDAIQIELWKLQQQIARVNAAVAAGHLTSAEAQAQIQSIQSQAQTSQTGTNPLVSTVLERLIDARIQSGLAAQEGVTVTPAQVDAKIVDESTTPESRHAWVIAVEPAVDTGKTVPTDAQKAAAKKIADQALTDITTGGKKWEDVAKSVSTDTSKATGGDLGWIDKTSSEDQPYLDAIFAAEQGKPTAVIEGKDGIYRIGRVTEIAPASVDPAWLDKIKDAGLKVETYRSLVQAEVVRQSLEDKVVADASKPGPQRHVLEIEIQSPQTPPGAKAIKVRHILFSPKHDPSGASALPSDDPTWSEAQLAAQAEYDKLKADPTKFDELARKDSDEQSAQGDTGTGGKLPYFDETSQIDQAFADAILKDGLTPGELLPPVRSAFGWHVIQVMYRPPDLDQMKKVRDQAVAGTDFSQLARDNSEAAEAGKGGDLGFVAQGQLDARLSRAIFATPIGQVSDIVEIPNVGTFLFKVLAEEQRTPDATQLDLLKQRAFTNWYGEKKDAVTITRNLLDEAAATQ